MSEKNTNTHTQPLDTEPLDQEQMRKTSSVPLRKETVRVTLKSTPAGAKSAPPTPSASKAPMPTSMTPNTAPHTTKSPSTHNPDIPDVTSAVPLKEETMRVTLKADSETNSPTPSAAPVAPPSPSPIAPKSAPKMPAPTVPLGRPAAAPKAPAPTIPLGGAAKAPKIAAPAPTIPLNVGGAASVPLATTTQPLATASQPLPKATVQLQQTQQLTKPGVSPAGGQATIKTVTDEDASADRAGNGETILAVAAFLLSLFLLFTQFQRAGIWIDEHEDGSYGAVFTPID